MIKAKGLGRGLDALLGSSSGGSGATTQLRVEQLSPGKYQPRTHMDPDSLDDLAASIRSQGIMQPILVRAIAQDAYEIIAGERRWRAAQLAGLQTVPVLIRDIPDDAALAMSLIENIQRENLNPIEEAAGLQRLVDEFGMTHQAAAEAVGRSRSATSNLLRLLHLPPPVQDLLMTGQIDMGHARSLLSLDPPQQLEVATAAAQRKLSVRQTEAWVKRLLDHNNEQPASRQSDPDVLRLQEKLSQALGTGVEIHSAPNGRGRIIIQYSSLDHLEVLLKRLR